MPGAPAGAIVGNATPAVFPEFLLGLLTVSSRLHTLLSGTGRGISRADAISLAALALIGTITGFASALSGTGGPLVLVPILLWHGCPLPAVVGPSQVIQLPIAVLTTAGHLIYGSLDLMLAGLLSVGLAIGACSGAYIAHALSQAILGRIVSIVAVVGGKLIFVKIAAPLVV